GRDHGLGLAQRTDRVVALLRARDAATGRVDAQDHPDDVRRVAVALERVEQVGRVADRTVDVDDADARAVWATSSREPRDHDRAEQQRQPDETTASRGHPRLPRSAPVLVAPLALDVRHHVRERELPAFALALHVGLDLFALLAAPQGLDGEADALLAGIDAGDSGLDDLPHLEERRRLLDPLARELRDVDETLDPLLELHEDAEVGDAAHGAGDPPPDRVAP